LHQLVPPERQPAGAGPRHGLGLERWAGDCTRTVGDSLVGRALYRDTTRSAVARSAIDSLRTQETDMGKTLIVGTGVTMAVLYAFAQGLNF
jgi:hypothetical protein